MEQVIEVMNGQWERAMGNLLVEREAMKKSVCPLGRGLSHLHNGEIELHSNQNE
jgi:hypothetical protein